MENHTAARSDANPCDTRPCKPLVPHQTNGTVLLVSARCVAGMGAHLTGTQPRYSTADTFSNQVYQLKAGLLSRAVGIIPYMLAVGESTRPADPPAAVRTAAVASSSQHIGVTVIAVNQCQQEQNRKSALNNRKSKRGDLYVFQSPAAAFCAASEAAHWPRNSIAHGSGVMELAMPRRCTRQ